MAALTPAYISASPAKLKNGKTCELVRELTKVSEECFLEPECGEECRTEQEKKCSTVQEQQCRTVQEEQCNTIQVSQAHNFYIHSDISDSEPKACNASLLNNYFTSIVEHENNIAQLFP